jgi:hypothetical protein
MRVRHTCLLLHILVSLVTLQHPAHADEYQTRLIPFEDLKPEGARITVCWAGIGIDHNQRVYFAASDQNDKRPDDTVIFRYDTRTDSRQLLGTLRGISQAQGNLEPDESIGKIHVSFMEHRGKMYFSSHDYHDIKSDYSDIYDHRGGHFYAFDLKKETFQDLSLTDNYGVSVPYQGIIAMDILRSHNKLAGFTFPMGDLLIYDLRSRKTTFYPGVPEYRMRNVAREIWATSKGKVYFTYAEPDFWIWELDIKTGVIRRTEQRNIVSHGFLHGMVATNDGKTVYLTDNDGHLFAFDTKRESLRDLGLLLPDDEIADGREIEFVNGLALSKDERRLYSLPCQFEGGGSPALYEYDTKTGAKRCLARFPTLDGGTVTGNGVIDDSGRLYYGYHVYDTDSADEPRVQLLQVIPSDP